MRKFKVLPPHPDKCQVCATQHDPAQPHNKDSLYYQAVFLNENNGKSPTWLDAMAHCTEEIKQRWKKALTEKGVDLA